MWFFLLHVHVHPHTKRESWTSASCCAPILQKKTKDGDGEELEKMVKNKCHHERKKKKGQQ